MLIRRNKNRAFTIVELLTVMSIIIILISLLLPALQRVQQYAKEVRQQAQFHSLKVGINMFHNENGEYPPSDQLGGDGVNSYCGAMKLAEAMVGQDLLGYHPDSSFRIDLDDSSGNHLYLKEGVFEGDLKDGSLNVRKGPYLELDQSGAKRMGQIYDDTDLTPFIADANEIFVLTDVFEKRMFAGDGGKHGMPILYYKASDIGNANPNEEWQSIVDEPAQNRWRIYRHEDNDDLVQLGIPFDASADYHPMDETNGDPGPLETFYYRINNDEIKLENGRPYRPDSYILLSAGVDGLYGTRDDIYNFQD